MNELQRSENGGADFRDIVRIERNLEAGQDEYRFADVNGEQYGFKEATLALMRSLRQRKERFDLLHQVIYQFLCLYFRIAGNIIDRLFRINLGKLPANLRQVIHQMTTHLKKTRFKNRK